MTVSTINWAFPLASGPVRTVALVAIVAWLVWSSVAWFLEG